MDRLFPKTGFFPAFYLRFKQYLVQLGLLPVSIRTILLVVNFIVLALPLGSIFFFRIYENQLVRETEAELIAQSAFIGEIYKREIRFQFAKNPKELVRYGRRLEFRKKDEYGYEVASPQDEYYTPQSPRLDLMRDEIWPRRPEALSRVTEEFQEEADPVAVRAGRQIRDILLEAQRTTLAGMRVLDKAGIVVAGRAEMGDSLAHVEEVRRAMLGQYVSVFRQRISDEPPPGLASISRGTGIRIFTAFPIVEEERLWGVVYLSRTPKSILKQMYGEKFKLMSVAAILVALALFIALMTSWTIARPIYRLIRQVQKTSRGERPDPALELHGTREMALLSDNFTRMAQALETRADYIKQFATHMSHEFKTPLTSIKGAAELLEEHCDGMSGKERERFLRNIIQDADRMKQLVDRLMELARADNPETAISSGQPERICLSDVFAWLAKRYKEENFTLLLPSKPDTLPCVQMPEEALQTVLANLVDNARHHHARRVRMEVQETGETVDIFICDNGEGITPANRIKIFDPFFTTRRREGGTGLGLTIVTTLLHNHGGHIRLGDEPGLEGKGAMFIVSLPKGE